MEQKLAEFRARKVTLHQERGDTEKSLKKESEEMGPREKTFTVRMREKLYGTWARMWSKNVSVPQSTEVHQTSPQVPGEDILEPFVPSSQNYFLSYNFFLKILLWLVLLGLFVELEFGLAYFIISMFYWLYEGTRGPGEKRRGEKSAYSVFNPGCEAIQGTITAEQFERELLYGTVF
ncbi:SAYSvFN domain-containing protein 1 [Bombina bombina]|uniref:SAYSvFN domain-containing protein 1 n=1 Tax=Bombina bombina TaxID=8345 RepID=UPI00235AA864|nr:SAYSvFN domain-containing protein 1 [Bombina bombina]XP_053568654.1 SAYSvFN domain-containing protein 1 [Bombina bombina]XP_053568655.1 SAYSvFN domain-containing protein 1 [Bombina bombina]XP_053568656.1 SAYSvFN domain-containing protein 1 [Bombina bombina]XP_053568657.1 SAYSvFN domain-containing protein 1 [Bombina bombina]